MNVLLFILETEAELYDHYVSSHAMAKGGSDSGITAFDEEERTNERLRAFVDGSMDETGLNSEGDVSNKQHSLAVCATVACPLCQKECNRDTNELEMHLAQVCLWILFDLYVHFYVLHSVGSILQFSH